MTRTQAIEQAVAKTLEENGHLADGDVCTLKDLRDAYELPNDTAERDALMTRIDAKIEYWQIGEPSTSPTVELLTDIKQFLEAL